MAQTAKSDRGQKVRTIAVKIDRAIVTQAKMVAAYRGTTISDVLGSAARDSVDRQYRETVRTLAARVG
jgi:hypothetical protein